jgi:Fur family transcriptional regulator, peroxide stress response regulator
MEHHISSVTQQVKHLGKRLTVQRRAVLLHLLSTVTCPTAKDVYIALKHEMPNITLSTVYTSLRFFVKIGIVKEHSTPSTASRFECIISAAALDLREVM